MTETNTELNTSSGNIINPSPKTKEKKKGTFTTGQSIFLILLTLVLSVGGWFAYGKMNIWVDIDMQRVNQQLEFYQQKVQSEPNNTSARVELGYTYFLKGKNNEAIKEFNQALVLDPKFFDAYYNLGLVLNKEKRYNEALEDLNKAVELAPRDYKGHLQMGIAYRNLGMYEDAMKALSQANKLMPTNADIIFEIGQVAEAQGDKKLASDIYKEVLTYDPLFKDAVDALERLGK